MIPAWRYGYDDKGTGVVKPVKSTTRIRCRGMSVNVTDFHCLIGPARIEREFMCSEAGARYGFVCECYPETGHHPAAVGFGIRNLRAWAKLYGKRVIFSTDSPLVVNEMDPDEVTIVAVIKGKVRCTPIWRTPHFDERFKVYALGELWLSYCDGITDSLKAPSMKELIERKNDDGS